MVDDSRRRRGRELMLASCRLAFYSCVRRETVARQVLSKHFQHRCKGLEEIQAGLNANNVSKAARVVANVGKLTDLVESRLSTRSVVVAPGRLHGRR